MRRPVLRVSGWLVRVGVGIAPPVLLLTWAGQATLARLDALLAQAAPLAASVASQSLGRPVGITALSPHLSVRGLWTMVRNPDAYGSLPIVAEGITLGNKPSEIPFAGGNQLARVGRVTAFVSLPTLLSGKFSDSVSRILVEDTDATVVRFADGKLNINQIVPKPKPGAKPSPPFHTIVEVVSARIQFRDFASKRPELARTRQPAINLAQVPSAVVDLSGTRLIRFTATARPQSGTPTASRLRGELFVSGSARRTQPSGELYIAPDGPSDTAPLFLVQVKATGADIPYWYYYFVAAEKSFAVTAGRADVNATIGVPRPPGASLPTNPQVLLQSLSVSIAARVEGADLTLQNLRQPLRSIAGTVGYADGALQFDAGATVLGESIKAAGSLWNLPTLAESARPRGSVPLRRPDIAATFSVPRVPLQRVTRELLPSNVKLPPQLAFDGIASVRGTLYGRLTGKPEDVSSTATVSGINATYQGFPGVRDLGAQVAYSNNVARVSNLTASLDGGGTVRADVTARLTGNPRNPADATFSAHVDNVALSTITNLKLPSGQIPVALRRDARLRLSGRASAVASGQLIGGRATGGVNVTTAGLALGDIPFPVAQARVLVENNLVTVPSLRIESPVGRASVEGDVLPLKPGGIPTPTARLGLRFGFAALDLARIGRAAGISGLSGMVSGAGTVGGSLQDPQVRVGSLVALNLRALIPPAAQSGQAAPKPLRVALDSLVANGLVVSRRQVQITRPVVLRRFPASVAITGNVSNLLPVSGAAPNPTLALSATVQNLDAAEVQRQLGLSARAAARAVSPALARITEAAGAPGAPATAASADNGGVSGSITQAVVRVRGTARAPRIAGSVVAGNILVGRYPLEGASLLFDFNRQRTAIRDVKVKASVGQVTGDAVVRADGTLSGNFQALDLDVERLSFLTNTLVSVGGRLNVRGIVAGSVRRPQVTAQITVPRLRVGETIYENLTAQNLRFTGSSTGGTGVVELPRFSLQNQDTSLSVSGARFDIASRAFVANVSLENGDIGRILDTVRRSGISETPSGAKIVQALGRLPQPLEGRFDVQNLAVRGRFDADGNLVPQATGVLRARNLQVGTFKTDSLVIDAGLNGRIVTINNFTATQPGATIRGGGTYDPDGQVNAFVETNEASLDLVRTIPGLAGFPVYGTLEDFTIRVTGPARKPQVHASLQGRDLLVVQTAAPPTKTAIAAVQKQIAKADDLTAPAQAGNKPANPSAPPVNPTAVVAEPLRGYLLSLVRVEGELSTDANGNDRIFIPDIYVRAGNAEIRGEVQLPVAYDLNATEPIRVQTDRDVNVRLTVPPIELATFVQSIQPTTQPGTVAAAQAAVATAPPPRRARDRKAEEAARLAKGEVGGTAEATVAVTGRLDQPQLSGFIRVTDGKFRAPRPEGGRDQISNVNNFNANLVLKTTPEEGSRIVFDQFLLTLGGLNGEKGDKGTLGVTGSIRIDTLEDLGRLVRGTQNGDLPAPQLRGAYDLLATFKQFRPAVDNFFQLQEAGQGQADGKLAITGALLTPRIASVEGPIKVTRARVRPPVKEAALPTEDKTNLFNPSFDIALTIPDKATLTNQTLFSFDVQGNASITGKLFADKVQAVGQAQPRPSASSNGTDVGIKAELQTVGGFLQFPTAYFRVQKRGTILFRYGTVNPGIIAQDVIAKGTVKVAPGARLAGTNSTNTFSGQVLSQDATATQQYVSYNITATVNGSLDILDTAGSARTKNGEGVQQKNPISLSSDPPLSESQIYGLLLTQQQADLISQGRVGDALGQIGSYALTNAIIPRALSPLTEGIASTFGLEDFSIDYGYNPDAPIRIRILKRLPDPFNRFLIDTTRAFQTRNNPGVPQPYQFGFSYELYQFTTSKAILPRLQIGFQTDEQRTNTFFLRGSVAY